MPDDPINPGAASTSPPPPAPEPPRVDPPVSTGLPSNVAATLACIPLVGGIIFWFLEKCDPFVRFYAMQSIIYGLAWFVFNIVSNLLHLILLSIPVVGGFFAAIWWFIAAIANLGVFLLMIIAMIKAFSGSRWDIPYVGPMARKYTGETI